LHSWGAGTPGWEVGLLLLLILSSLITKAELKIINEIKTATEGK